MAALALKLLNLGRQQRRRLLFLPGLRLALVRSVLDGMLGDQ